MHAGDRNNHRGLIYGSMPVCGTTSAPRRDAHNPWYGSTSSDAPDQTTMPHASSRGCDDSEDNRGANKSRFLASSRAPPRAALGPSDRAGRRRCALLAVGVLYVAQGLLKIAGLPLEYIIKDAGGASPAASQALSAVVQLPWLAKPCLGLLVDFAPICRGCSKGLYLLLAGALIASGWGWLCSGGETASSSGIGVTIALFSTATGAALSDVIADGLICSMGNRGEQGSMGSDVMRLLAAARGCKTVGQMLGEALGGILVQSLGPRITLGASALVIPALVSVAGALLMANPKPAKGRKQGHKAQCISSTWQMAFTQPQMLQVALVLLLVGLALNPGSALFYFYTSPIDQGGLAFGPAFVGQLRTGMAAARAAALLMNATVLATMPADRLLEGTCVVGAAVGLLQTFIVTSVPSMGINGLEWLAGPGMVVTSLLLAAVVRIAGIVVLGMAAKLCCELGGEASTFSVLMTVWNGSHILAKLMSSAVMAAIGISARDLSSMPVLMGICSISMLLPMLVVAQRHISAWLRIRSKTD